MADKIMIMYVTCSSSSLKKKCMRVFYGYLNRRQTTSCPILKMERILVQTVMTIWMRLFTDAELQSHK